MSGALFPGILVKKVCTRRIDDPHERAAVFPAEQKTKDPDEAWLYETGLAGEYYVRFKNGRVVRNERDPDRTGGQE